MIAELGEKVTEQKQAVKAQEVVNAGVATELVEEQGEQKLVLEQDDHQDANNISEQEGEEAIGQQQQEEEWPNIHQDALLADEPAKDEDAVEEETLVIGELADSEVEQDQDQHSEKTTEANASEEAIAEQEEFPLGELKFSGDDH